MAQLSGRAFQHLSWGVAFCFICIWSTYLTFENYAEHERQKELYEDQLQAARDRLEEALDQVNSLQNNRETETNLRRIRQLESHLKATQDELKAKEAQALGHVVQHQQQQQEDRTSADDNDKREPPKCSIQPPCPTQAVPMCTPHPPRQQQQQAVQQVSSSNLRLRKRAKHGLDMKMLSSNDSIVKFHIISHTHWDREWYLPFEQFRGRLVNLLDDVLDQIDNDPSFKHFHLDGQMIPVDDYVEIRSHMKDKFHLANLEHKVALGPWYVQPDEFLVSGEALVRNLMLGIRKADAMGGSSLVGYIPDSFGHIAQMPQMLLGFNIDTAVSGRGVDTKQSSELWWQSPDGSRVLFIFLRKWYCNGLDMPRKNNQTALIPWYAKKYKELVVGSKTSHLLLMNGCDHTAPQPEVGTQIEVSNKKFQENGLPTLVVHSNLDDYVALVKDELTRNEIPLSRWPGEMRVSIDHLANTLSVMITQKMMNWRIGTLFEKWMEPMEALAWKVQGRKYDHDRLWYAWRVLMENHPHDSICGCSVSEVHNEVNTRFAKARQVGEQLVNTAISKFFRHFVSIPPGVITRGRIFVFNPSNLPRDREIIYAQVEAPIEKKPRLRVTDAEGRVMTIHLLEIMTKVWTYELPDNAFRRSYNKAAYRVAVEVSVPAHGYGVYTFDWIDTNVNEEEDMVLINQMLEEAKANESKEKMRKADYHGEGDEDEGDEDDETDGENGDKKKKKTQKNIEESEEVEEQDKNIEESEETTHGGKSKREEVIEVENGIQSETVYKTVEGLYKVEEQPDESGVGQAAPSMTSDTSSSRNVSRNQRSLLAVSSQAVRAAPATQVLPTMPPASSLDNTTMENEYLHVTIRQDGRPNILHKASGVYFSYMSRFEEGPDGGTEYVFKRKSTVGVLFSSSQNTELVSVHHYTTHSITHMTTSFYADRSLVLDIFYVLAKASRRLDVRVNINNQRSVSHRVRALFQPPFAFKEVYADTQFEVIKRAYPTSKYFGQMKYVMVYDQERKLGLAVANRGLPEYNFEQGVLGLTLLRAVDKLGDWGKFPTPTALEKGIVSVEYSIIPFSNENSNSEFKFAVPDAEARKFNEPMVAIPVKDYAGYFPDSLVDPGFSDLQAFTTVAALRSSGDNSRRMSTIHDGRSYLPEEAEDKLVSTSMFEVRPRHFVVSTLKKAEDRESLILRFYNAFDVSDTARVYVSPLIKFTHAYRCELSELRRDDAPLDVQVNADGSRVIKLSVGPKKIVTLELE